PASSALSFAIASSRGSPTYSAGSIGTVLEVGVALGVVGAVVGDVGGGVVGSGSVPLGCTAITMMMAMSATASSDTIAMSGHIQGLRRRASAGGGVPPEVVAEGSTRVVAAVEADSRATAPAATPGTAAAAP